MTRPPAMELLWKDQPDGRLDCNRVYCGDSLVRLPDIVDMILTDTPFSERTYRGHNATKSRDRSFRRVIDYPPWTERNVYLAAETWSASCLGWIVVITDDWLAPIWRLAFERMGMVSFAALPAVCPGSRVRLCGDGPSSYSWLVVVARPRGLPYSRWGTLCGHYVVKPERGMLEVGGKPLDLMRQLVADYSRPGDWVCDPCCGGGTTGVAALELDRNSLQIDIRRAAARRTIKRMERAITTRMSGTTQMSGEAAERKRGAV